MGIINYDLKIKKSRRELIYSLLLVILSIIFLRYGNFTTSSWDVFWRVIITLFMIFKFIHIIGSLIDIKQFKKYRQQEKEKSSFENSYNQYRQKKYEYNYNYQNEFEQKRKKFEEDWFEFYNRVTTEDKKNWRSRSYDDNKGYDEYNQNNRNYTPPKPSVSDKISKAFQLLKLKPSDSIDIIKARYRELAIKWHPDKWTLDTKENQNIANRNFQKLTAAYDIIKQYKNIK